MQYELSEQEARHIEKYRALDLASQGAVDLFMDRVAGIQARVDYTEANRTSPTKKAN